MSIDKYFALKKKDLKLINFWKFDKKIGVEKYFQFGNLSTLDKDLVLKKCSIFGDHQIHIFHFPDQTLLANLSTTHPSNHHNFVFSVTKYNVIII